MADSNTPANKANEVASTDQGKAAVKEAESKKAVQDNKYGEPQKRDPGFKRSRDRAANWMAAKQQQQGFGAYCLNDAGKKNLKIKDDLAGKNEDTDPGSQQRAQDNLKEKIAAFKKAQSAKGSSNWADLCDNLGESLKAFREMREAEGKSGPEIAIELATMPISKLLDCIEKVDEARMEAGEGIKHSWNGTHDPQPDDEPDEDNAQRLGNP